jgi:hypothetical protein
VAVKILIGALAALAAASTPTVRDSDYLVRLVSAEHELAAAESAGAAPDFEARRAARSTALQNLAVMRAQVGDHAGALEAYRSMQSLYSGGDSPKGTEATANLEYAQSTLARFTPEPAIAAIVRAARGRQIVILNEAHHVPRHRAFGMLLALELRKLGFEYLAMETFAPDVESLARRGYPTVADGFYSDEPLFGDFIRQALRAGYRPIAYEQTWIAATESSDMVDRIESREEAQANNLVERVLKRDPGARLFVYVGYSHAYKGYQDMPGNRRTAWMAERLRAKSGIDPLCIDQTSVIEPETGSRDRALLDAIFATRADDAVVLADRSTPALFNSPDPGRIDLQVFHRPSKRVSGRPDWLAMGGYRKPRAIQAKLMPTSGRRLVQAFLTGESASAVPVDQVLVTAGSPAPVFMLPKGKYRFAFQE